MQFADAIAIVNKIGDEQGEGLLETLMFMQVPSNREELTGEELQAHRVVFTEMRKLFIKE